jgi:hypothetical protein
VKKVWSSCRRTALTQTTDGGLQLQPGCTSRGAPCPHPQSLTHVQPQQHRRPAVAPQVTGGCREMDVGAAHAAQLPRGLQREGRGAQALCVVSKVGPRADDPLDLVAPRLLIEPCCTCIAAQFSCEVMWTANGTSSAAVTGVRCGAASCTLWPCTALMQGGDPSRISYRPLLSVATICRTMASVTPGERSSCSRTGSGTKPEASISAGG